MANILMIHDFGTPHPDPHALWQRTLQAIHFDTRLIDFSQNERKFKDNKFNILSLGSNYGLSKFKLAVVEVRFIM